MFMTENGISTTTTPGQEQYEYYTISRHMSRKLAGQKRCHYEYRHTDGKLFSCTAPTLESCRAKRDEWLSNRSA